MSTAVTVTMVLHILITISLVGIILLQRNEGSSLGAGSSANSFMTARGTANLLTRITAILVTCFFATSLLLALLSRESGRPISLIEASENAPTAPQTP